MCFHLRDVRAWIELREILSFELVRNLLESEMFCLLGEFPPSVGRLTDLIELDFSANAFYGEIGDCILSHHRP